jgi:phage terminase large subunit-like protein
MGFFVGCKSWERKRALCENGVIRWLQEWGEEKRALGGRGIFMARGTHSTIIEKIAPEQIRVVVGSVQFKLIQF